MVVVATTKVRIFKQITTDEFDTSYWGELLLLPQRYVFSSKSQHSCYDRACTLCCCCYHKGTYFQANHNMSDGVYQFNMVVVATTKVRIFKQITTTSKVVLNLRSCCCYHKGTYFQANHNKRLHIHVCYCVVVATTKVRIFKQITTNCPLSNSITLVVVATTKVRIFKQITTYQYQGQMSQTLLLLPQRYVFSSKSQQFFTPPSLVEGCCCYHKGTYFQANHNKLRVLRMTNLVVVATTKVRIFKQITTNPVGQVNETKLLLLPQRYVFSSKSQHVRKYGAKIAVVVATTKVRIFKQITTFV